MLGGSDDFDKRVRLIERARRNGRKGEIRIVGAEGLVITQRRRGLPSIPFRGLAYIFFGFVLFKSIALAQIGMQGYLERVEALKQGTVVEQAGAFLMKPDAASVWMAGKIAPLIR